MKEKYSDSRKRIVVITSPISIQGIIPLSNLFKILNQFSYIYLITNETARVIVNNNLFLYFNLYIIKYNLINNYLLKFFNYLLWHIKSSIKILSLYRKFNIFLFFLGENLAIMPILICRILRKPVILLLRDRLLRSQNILEMFSMVQLQL